MKCTCNDRRQKHSVWSLEPQSRDSLISVASLHCTSPVYWKTFMLSHPLFGARCNQVYISLLSVTFKKKKKQKSYISAVSSIYYLEFLNFRTYTPRTYCHASAIFFSLWFQQFDSPPPLETSEPFCLFLRASILVPPPSPL